jgi:hypothetical protein
MAWQAAVALRGYLGHFRCLLFPRESHDISGETL